MTSRKYDYAACHGIQTAFSAPRIDRKKNENRLGVEKPCMHKQDNKQVR